MSEIVVIPACNRPELLALCLQRLDGTGSCPPVHIYADTAANLDDIEYARNTYFPTATILSAKEHIKVPSGCWNILNAIKSGSQFANSVYLVEEDVMVYPHFFDWHRSQVAEASCGRLIPRYDYYTNPGSCLRRSLLDKLVPHINDDYFSDTKAYCERNFPAAHHTSTLDDGLIRRVIDTWVFPKRPACAHQGLRGYCRLDIFQNFEVGVENRKARFLEIAKLIETSTDPIYRRYSPDFEPFVE